LCRQRAARPQSCNAKDSRERTAVLHEFIPNPLILPVGLIMGLLVAAPVGPVNVLCIQRAVERGALGGIAAGLGAVLGDGVIALFAALWVGAITGAVERYRDVIQLIGGMALIVFGVMLSVTRPRIEPKSANGEQWGTYLDYLWDVPKTFFLTVTNPGPVLGLIAIFGGVSSFVEVRSNIEALVMVAAIMGGSLVWWVTLSLLVGRIRHLVDQRRIRTINLVAGILLSGFGLVLIGELVAKATGLA
jgi:threonine/homoserine/homoserine lactone efflux protein